MKKLFLSLAFIIASMPALAMTLDEGRNSGAVNERADGYIEVTKPNTEASQLVAEVNARRKAEYQRISKENGQPIDVVAKLAAAQIAKKLGR